MYTVVGGILITVIGILFVIAGVFAGNIAMKNKLRKENEASED